MPQDGLELIIMRKMTARDTSAGYMRNFLIIFLRNDKTEPVQARTFTHRRNFWNGH